MGWLIDDKCFYRGESDKKLDLPLHFYKSRGSSTMDGVKKIRLQADTY